MPYKIRKRDNKYCVVKIKDDGSEETIPGGCHATKEEAESHRRAIGANKHVVRESNMDDKQSYNFYVKNISSEFSVVDEDQMIIEGYFTDGKVDIDGHIIDQKGLMDATEDYMRWGNIRDMHGLPVGKVLDFPEWNKVVVQILDDTVWKKIKSGLYRGFSVGIRAFDFINEPALKYTDSDFEGVPQVVVDAVKEVGEVLRITKMLLAEISIVDRPANPRALFTGIKALESEGYDILPVPEPVKKAQTKININKGVSEMSEKTQEQELEVTEEVQKEVADTAENETVVDDNQEVEDVAKDAGTEEVASFEDRIATLEGKVESVEKSINDRFEGFEAQLTKAIDLFEKASQSAETEDAVEEAVEDEEVETTEVAEKSTTTTEEKSFDPKEIAEIASKAAVEAYKALKEKEVEDGEQRLGGVNDGEESEEVQKALQSERPVKPTYKTVAEKLSMRIHGGGINAN